MEITIKTYEVEGIEIWEDEKEVFVVESHPESLFYLDQIDHLNEILMLIPNSKVRALRFSETQEDKYINGELVSGRSSNKAYIGETFGLGLL